MTQWLGVTWNRLRAAFRKSDLDRELNEELASHLELLTEENQGRGMPPEEARRAAHVKLGGAVPMKELHRDTRGLPSLDSVLQDLRYTFRTFRRDAGFATFAILIAGLGIGASATVFSVVNSLLLRPLPFRDPGRLVWISNHEKDGLDLSGQTTQVGNLLDLRNGNKSFSDMAAYFAFYGVGDNKLIGNGEPERLSGVPVSQNFFPLLGVSPELGRLFNAAECKWNGPGAVLLSHGLWVRRFASDPSIVGRALTINDQAVTVVGVLPASFDFASVFAPGSHIDLFFPFALSAETNRWGNTLAIIGRLKPGVTLAAAQAESTVLSQRITRDHVRDRNDFDAKLTFLKDHVSGRFHSALLVLIAAVGVVMLIVCANLSNLLLARSATRRKEIAIRTALGASRGRLIRQTLTESLMLSLCGAALGLVLAFFGTKALSRLDAMNIPLLASVHLDAAALGFTLAIALLTGLVFGLAPALEAPARALHDALKDSGRGSSESRRHNWIRSSLVVSEIAFACVLLVGAGLLIRSFLRVLDVNLGFQPERAAALRVDPGPQYKTPAQVNAYFDEVLRRVKGVPGIQDAGLTDVLPLGRNRSWGVRAKGRVYAANDYTEGFVRIVTEGYIKAMGIPIKAGREFSPHDTLSSQKVILLNETMARNLFPGQNAIGQVILGADEYHVAGVVSDVRHLALEQGAGNEFYLSMKQGSDYASVDLVVRTTLPPAALASSVRAALEPIAPNLPTQEFRTLQQIVDKAVSPRRFIVVLLSGFAAFALILASLGIYGVISYSVSQRTQEIGIRMALGASARDVQSRIILRTLSLAAIGMLLGVAASWALARTISSLLFGVTAADPVTFMVMLVTLTAVAVLAGYVPARRASRIDPMSALRTS